MVQVQLRSLRNPSFSWKVHMAKGSKKPIEETAPLKLPTQLQTVRVSRPKNVVTVVTDVDDIDVRDGSLLLIRRSPNGRETCMMVFSPGQWTCANVDPI